jgi:hypothetical protein
MITINDLLIRTVLNAIELLQKNPKIRLWFTVVFGILSISGLILYLLNPLWSLLFRDSILGVTIATSVFFGFGIAAYSPVNLKDILNPDFELFSIREEQAKIRKRVPKTPKEDLFTTIQLNLNQTTEYYAISKRQAQSSFGFSVFASVVGLAVLVAGIWVFYFSDAKNLSLATVTGIAGILSEFIGAAYFYMYRKTISQMNFFYVYLARLQDTMLAVKLMEDMDDLAKQVVLREKIVMALIKRSSFSMATPMEEKASIESEQVSPEK